MATHAAVVYTDIDDVTVKVGESQNFDINNDGINDFNISQKGCTMTLTPLNGASVAGSALYVSRFSDMPITTEAAFQPPNASRTLCAGRCIGNLGNWCLTNTERIAAIRFDIEGTHHLGWIGFSTPQTWGETLTVTRFAYEDCAGETIFGGATSHGSECTATDPIGGSGFAPSTDHLDTRYERAVGDASQAEVGEIRHQLLNIIPQNQRLVWEKGDARTDNKVLMITWTSWDGYAKKIGQDMDLSREVWATAAPELQDFCKALSYKSDANKLNLRLEQLMGLPPNNGKTHIVELWVSPDDLFRPCPDPEVTDSECELDFPRSAFMQVSAEHQAWINDLRAKSYGEGGYPWTSLGYTYDWGNKESEVGLSEFVIQKGATVTIKNVQTTQDYCH